MKRSEYLYISGVLKSRENYLLTSEKMKRLTYSKDLKELQSELRDTDYSELGAEIRGIEEKIMESLKEAYSLIDTEKFRPLTNILYLSYNSHNLKLLTKFALGLITKEEAISLFIDFGDINRDLFDDFLNNSTPTPTQIPEYSSLLDSAMKLYKKDENLYILESYIDMELLKNSVSIAEAKKYGDEFLADFANFLRDMEQKIILMRVGNLDLDLSAYHGLIRKELLDEQLENKFGTGKEIDSWKISEISKYFERCKYEAYGAETVILYFFELYRELYGIKNIILSIASGRRPSLV